MAKSTKNASKADAPNSIVLRLNAPGMSPLHRAGLGGLAATLRAADMMRKQAEEEDEELPAVLAPLCAPEFSWSVEKTSVTLNWSKPENAGRFFEALSNFAFQIRDGVIYLPGQYKINASPSKEVRVRLQKGLTLTFLQHGQTRKLGEEITETYQFDEKSFEYKYKPCLSYTHQKTWNDWTEKGKLAEKYCSFQGPFYPGAVVRHVAFANATGAAQSVELVIALAFAIVGSIALPATGGLGVLIVPHVTDLISFAQTRRNATPSDVKSSYISGLSDALLRFALNERGEEIQKQTASSGCEGVCFRTTPWSTQQKSRCETLSLKAPSYETLNAYSLALRHFKTKIKAKTIEIKEGKGKKAVVVGEKTEYFYSVSTMLPFVADNLVRGKYWFEVFAKYVKSQHSSGKTIWDIVKYEHKEINDMINDNNLSWKLEGAKSLTLAVQDALRRLYGKIGAESENDAARKNRFSSEYDKWRMAFAGAKTEEQFRNSFADMMSRAKSINQLADDWQAIVALVLRDWELARDLALLALAGYKGKGEQIEETEESSSEAE